MKKFEGLLIASDLDGTLLKYDKTISEENKAAIEYFKSGGGLFTFITGRIPLGARLVLEQITPNAPIGCINGVALYDCNKKEFLWSTELSKSVMELVEYVDNKFPKVGIEVNMLDRIYFCKKSEATEKHRTDEGFENLVCHYNDVKEPIAKILFAAKSEEIEAVAKDIINHPHASEYDFIRSDEEYFEILPKGASKGLLINKLSQILGIDIKNIVAIGDNDNDISMLKTAGISYAVSNASQGAKASAKFITVSNEEHAIARVIDDLDKMC